MAPSPVFRVNPLLRPQPDPVCAAWENKLRSLASPERDAQLQHLLDSQSEGAHVQTMVSATIEAGDREWLRKALGHPALKEGLTSDEPLRLAIQYNRPDFAALLVPRSPLGGWGNSEDRDTIRCQLLADAATAPRAGELLDLLLAQPLMQRDSVAEVALRTALLKGPVEEAVFQRLLPWVPDLSALWGPMTGDIRERAKQRVLNRTTPGQTPQPWDAVPDLAKTKPTQDEWRAARAPWLRLLDRISLHVEPEVAHQWVKEHGAENFPRWSAHQRAQTTPGLASAPTPRRRLRS